MENNSNVNQNQSVQSQSIDQLNSLAKSANAPSWSLGIAAILSAFVAFILALGLDVGGITDKWFQSSTELQMQELVLRQTALENELSTVSVLQDALNDANVANGQMKAELVIQKEMNYRLTVDNLTLAESCGINSKQPSKPPVSNVVE